jgi:hypothetical protein
MYVERLLARVAEIRLPELFATPVHALYHVADRQGVRTVVVRTTELTGEQLKKIMQYRLAQYLAAGFLDANQLYAAGLEHAPLSNVLPDDVHIIVGALPAGEI